MESSDGRGGNCHGCIYSLVYLVGAVLAFGSACLGPVSDRLASHIAFPARGDCRAWRICSVERVFLPSRARFAGSASDLTEEIPEEVITPE